jgi:hypothetical protein
LNVSSYGRTPLISPLVFVIAIVWQHDGPEPAPLSTIPTNQNAHAWDNKNPKLVLCTSIVVWTASLLIILFSAPLSQSSDTCIVPLQLIQRRLVDRTNSSAPTLPRWCKPQLGCTTKSANLANNLHQKGCNRWSKNCGSSQ